MERDWKREIVKANLLVEGILQPASQVREEMFGEDVKRALKQLQQQIEVVKALRKPPVVYLHVPHDASLQIARRIASAGYRVSCQEPNPGEQEMSTVALTKLEVHW